MMQCLLGHSHKGRITSKRESSKKLTFYHVENQGAFVQVMNTLSDYTDPHEFELMNKTLKRGDIIGLDFIYFLFFLSLFSHFSLLSSLFSPLSFLTSFLSLESLTVSF